ncbi:MAG: peptidylprolyl isomerase FKBP-type [Bacteroidota bacterium]|jgi:FKBP-type peptidyl-prolyl cis-trans isomerase|nr:peptidylprolyl isomerase FKBP-type [Bacteroidota bacterium]
MTNSFSKKLALAAVGTVVAFSACEKSDRPGYDKSESGLYTKFYNHDENGVKPKEGDMVRVSLVVKTEKDSILTDSKDPKFNRPGLSYYEFPLMKSEFGGSFEEAIASMSVGDSASFLVSVDSMYRGKDLPPFLKKGEMLTYETKLQKITAKEEVEKEQKKKMEEHNVEMAMRKDEEMKILSKFLEDNKITTKSTPSGLIFIEKTKGKGPHPKPGDKVKVNYTLSFVDGKVLETTLAEDAKKGGIYDDKRPYAPAEFTLGQLIKGMEEGMSMMSAGSKARLIIPSEIGYGEGGGAMPPYSTLIFDVELISFGPGDGAPAASAE